MERRRSAVSSMMLKKRSKVWPKGITPITSGWRRFSDRGSTSRRRWRYHRPALLEAKGPSERAWVQISKKDVAAHVLLRQKGAAHSLIGLLNVGVDSLRQKGFHQTLGRGFQPCM